MIRTTKKHIFVNGKKTTNPELIGLAVLDGVEEQSIKIINRLQYEALKKCANEVLKKKIKMKNKEKFNEWMKRIGNIYYHDNERMCNAYEKIVED